ncbi:MAG: succinyl-diaminopimelate desuccinylase [Rhodobacteraceae bacterium]|nr:succinyl-diaminopimelate desuccinylase [Paracoccaceae bacterium]
MSTQPVDPVSLTQRLVQCQSVTPNEGGAITILQQLLAEAGFSCQRIDRNDVANLYARWGDTSPVFGFNGHTDTVPAGNIQEWSVNPFGGEVKDGKLWGRGAADMKSGVASFVAAAIDFVNTNPAQEGSIAITVTGDEEAIAIDGSAAIIDWMQKNDQHMTVCLVGEPTCPEIFGEEIKVGRRGSLSIRLTMFGVQGHSAYPSRYVNPINAMTHFGYLLNNWELDQGTENFQPSIQAITRIETGNSAMNVVPAQCISTVNLRFNELHTTQSLTNKIKKEAEDIAKIHGCRVEVKQLSGAECFYTTPSEFTEIVSRAVKKVLGRTPQSSTSGGTSDARFFAPLCPVVEFGLVGKTMHQVDEHVPVEEIVKLKEVYRQCLDDYFQT